MIYTLNDKKIRIPDSTLEQYISFCGNKDIAIQTFLEDEGYLENPEQEELERKAKTARITATIHQARSTQKTQRERVKKIDPLKNQIINIIFDSLRGFSNIENLIIVNEGKLITFNIGADKFKLDLIKTKK